MSPTQINPISAPTQHTPGPWLAHGCSVYSAKVWSEGIATGDRYLASSAPLDESMPQDEDLANARLIAAAPEMLAALQQALDETVDARTYPDGPCIEKATRDLMRAAIAKATGGAS